MARSRHFPRESVPDHASWVSVRRMRPAIFGVAGLLVRVGGAGVVRHLAAEVPAEGERLNAILDLDGLR